MHMHHVQSTYIACPTCPLRGTQAYFVLCPLHIETKYKRLRHTSICAAQGACIYFCCLNYCRHFVFFFFDIWLGNSTQSVIIQFDPCFCNALFIPFCIRDCTCILLFCSFRHDITSVLSLCGNGCTILYIIFPIGLLYKRLTSFICFSCLNSVSRNATAIMCWCI